LITAASSEWQVVGLPFDRDTSAGNAFMTSRSSDTPPSQSDLVIVQPPDLSREMYRSVLAQKGYSTAAFDDIDAARQWLESPEHVTAAIILELLPSPDDTWSLIRKVRREKPDIAVILLTSVVRPDRANRRRAAATGVAAFVGKPCGVRQLVDIVTRVMSGERGIEVTHYAPS
jgi:DNA-binding NtrC family response regulator